MIDEDAGEPFYTFKKIHADFFKRLQTDKRLTSEYRIDTWGEGTFEFNHLPPHGVHGRYQRIRVRPVEESTGYYCYRIEVIVWILINGQSPEREYDLSELYLDRVMQIFTEKPDDWSLNGIVHNVTFEGTDYAQEWYMSKSATLCSASFSIYADIERTHT